MKEFYEYHDTVAISIVRTKLSCAIFCLKKKIKDAYNFTPKIYEISVNTLTFNFSKNTLISEC